MHFYFTTFCTFRAIDKNTFRFLNILKRRIIEIFQKFLKSFTVGKIFLNIVATIELPNLLDETTRIFKAVSK